MIVKCDIVNCKFNADYHCTAETIVIKPNHVNDSNGINYTEYIECSTYQNKSSETVVINKTKLYKDMSHYEQEIARFLHEKHGFPLEEAKDILERFYPVMERFGWDSNAKEWADNLNHIVKEKKATPEEWNEFINKFKGFKGIRPLKTPTHN